MDEPTPPHPGTTSAGPVPWARGRTIVLFGVAVALLSLVSSAVARDPQSALGLMWATSGLTVATLVAAPRAAWPRLVAALAVGTAASSLLLGLAVPSVVASVAAATVEAVVAAAIIGGDGSRPVRRGGWWVARLVAGAVVGVLAATAVASSQLLLVDGTPATLLVDHPLSRLTGIAVFGPVLVEGFLGRPLGPRRRWRASDLPPPLVTLATTVAVFGPLGGLPVAHLVVPPMLWTALRLRPAGSLATLAVTGWTAGVLTVRGWGPFAGATPSDAGELQLLRLYVVVLSALVLWVTLLADDRRTAATALHESEQLFRSTFDDALLGLAVIAADDDLTVLEANRAARTLLRPAGGPLVGGAWLDGLDATEADVLRTQVDRVVATGEPARLALWHGSDDRLLEVAMAPLHAGRSDGAGTTTLAVQLVDITARHRGVEATSATAHRDELTGLPGRHHVREQLSRWLVEGAEVAVVSGQLDGLGSVIDTLGRDAGDAVLRTVAERIDAAARQTDVVGRAGDDQFVVLVRGGPATEAAVGAAALADRIEQALRTALAVAGRDVRVGIALGIAVSRPNEGAESLLARAHRAMHRQRGTAHRDATDLPAPPRGPGRHGTTARPVGNTAQPVDPAGTTGA